MAEAGREVVRRTPYELVFVDGGHEEALHTIAREAESRAVDPASAERFVLLEGSGQLLRALRPDASSPATITQYGALVYQAFHFLREGRPLFVLDEPALRALLAEPPHVGDWELTAPARAGYLQLPRNLVWAPGEEDSAAEPVDGFFWTLAPDLASPAARLLLALILGVRPGRAGFGVIEAAATVPPPPAAHWADTATRETGTDFANILPGGEIQQLFALTSFGEALRLASLVFHAAVAAGVVGPEERAQQDASPSPHVLPPTELTFRRIALTRNG
jgi:hypothetical protein